MIAVCPKPKPAQETPNLDERESANSEWARKCPQSEFARHSQQKEINNIKLWLSPVHKPPCSLDFGEGFQMGLSNRTCLQLQVEGVEYLLDVRRFHDSDWDQFVSNCKRPNQIPDPANAGAFIYQPPFSVPVHSLQRLKVALVVQCVIIWLLVTCCLCEHEMGFCPFQF